MEAIRPVFYVSDGTGITAETIGHSLLTQFHGNRFETDRLPFVDSPDKARKAALHIRAKGDRAGIRPIVVNSCVDAGLSALLAESGALMLDVFAPFIEPLERELGQIRQERRPNSRYSQLDTCKREVALAESMLLREGIEMLSTTHASIEEISSRVLEHLGINREMY